MGTNYYWLGDVCEHCGRSDDRRHIGKSSSGWVFALRIYPEEGINDFPDWEAIWESGDGRINDEYGREISTEEMKNIITNRSHRELENPNEFHRENQSEDGPNGLVRSRIGKYGPVRHGEGTWDLYDREFF